MIHLLKADGGKLERTEKIIQLIYGLTYEVSFSRMDVGQLFSIDENLISDSSVTRNISRGSVSVQEILTVIPPEALQRMVNNYIRKGSPTSYSGQLRISDIATSFSWVNSPEGRTYWEPLYQELRNRGI